MPFFNQLTTAIEAEAPHKRTLGQILFSCYPFSLSALGQDGTSADNAHLALSLLTATGMSQGVPVFPMDCWMDESTAEFVSKLLAFRSQYLDLIQPDSFDAIRGIAWHGANAGHQPDWDGGMYSHFIGYSIRGDAQRGFYVGFNAYQTEIEVQAPEAPPGQTWKCAIYSALPNSDKEILVQPLSMFHMSAKTAVVLELIPDPNASAFMPEI